MRMRKMMGGIGGGIGGGLKRGLNPLAKKSGGKQSLGAAAGSKGQMNTMTAGYPKVRHTFRQMATKSAASTKGSPSFTGEELARGYRTVTPEKPVKSVAPDPKILGKGLAKQTGETIKARKEMQERLLKETK